MFRTRTWVPGCLGGRSRGAWAASPGLLGRLPGAPRGGVPAPNYKGQLSSIPVVDPSNSHQNLSRFWCQFLVVLGSILGPFGRSFSVMLAPSEAQVGLGTVLDPTYLRKSVCSRNIAFSNGFGPKLTPRWGQDRPKIALRWFQDRLGSLFCLEFLF